MRIALYNLHFQTLGGGERRTALLAAHLAQTHEVAIFSSSPIDKNRVTDLFGIDLSKSNNVLLPASELHHGAAIAAWNPDLFINNSYGSHLPCPGARGIYMCMFPEGQPEGFEGYQVITANSEFTKQWIAQLWGRASEVVYSAVEPMGPPATKEQIILNVGRFQGDGGQNLFKHQELLLNGFHRLQWRIDAPWEMHFVGTVGQQLEDRPYAELLRSRASRRVHFHFGLPQEELRELYRRATIYWHATGYGALAGNNPARQEHFGMTIVEAMSAGVIPLAFRAGGPCETIVHGINGFLWTRPTELLEYTRKLIGSPDLQQRMLDQAIRRSRQFDKEQYLLRMNAIISRLCAS
ncbi:MAG TPA: glycosyltransferase family 4 protein [Casimicrobiaceae bacterium]|nr:glycosyltransferase family 4 protein [Casimicrobiaceae bacterium]